jgi:hypothetical protein
LVAIDALPLFFKGMKEERSVDALQRFREVADRAGMCPAAALLEPEASSEPEASRASELRTDHSLGEGSVRSVAAEEAAGAASVLGRRGEPFPKRQMLECVCEGASVGGHSFLELLMRAPWDSGIFTVLVDSANAFDPASWDAELMEHLLWVRVANAKQLVRALDLLLRDDNFALVAADTRGIEARELQSIQPFAWYRLQRLAHQRAGGCVIFTDTPSVRCADRRTLLSENRVLDDLDRTREDLLVRLERSVCSQGRGQVLRAVGSH